MSQKDSEVTSHEVWPSKLNKVIIGAGIIAFGLIIVDRVTNIFRANELPEPVAIERSVETALVVEPTGKTDTDAATSAVTSAESSTKDAAESVITAADDAVDDKKDAAVAAIEPVKDATESATAAVENAADAVQAATADVDSSIADTAERIVESSDSATDATPEEPALEIEDIFGGSLVFVSASEPLFVLTEEEVRFDIGSSIDGEVTLAGITDQRVILEKAGELFVVELPTPGE